MGQITATRNLVATKVVRLAGQWHCDRWSLSSSLSTLLTTITHVYLRIRLFYNFIEPKECEEIHSALFSELQWRQREETRLGVTYLQPRLTAWFGDVDYTYSSVTQYADTNVSCGLAKVFFLSKQKAYWLVKTVNEIFIYVVDIKGRCWEIGNNKYIKISVLINL